MMNKTTKERRGEKRLHYELPVWFAEDFEHTAFRGVMVDISNSGMAFTCDGDDVRPKLGQRLMTRFNLPDVSSPDGSAMKSVSRSGSVCRVEKSEGGQFLVAIRFDEPPPFWNALPV